MNLSTKGFLNYKDSKLNLSNKVTTLNPNAAEFVPSALKSTYANTNGKDVKKLEVPETSAKEILDLSESSVSNNSDDEVHQFWRHQLPDDITPDFKAMGEDELLRPANLSLGGLSLHDGVEASRFSASIANHILGAQHEMSPLGGGNHSLTEKMGYGSAYTDDQLTATFNASGARTWDERFVNLDQQLNSGRDENQFDGDSLGSFVNNFSEQAVLEDAMLNPLEFLASQFPGFAAESLAEVFYANGCDLNLTIEILTQLELQVDSSFSQNVNSKALAAPSLTVSDFPALSAADAQNGLSKYSGDDQQTPHMYRSSASFKGSTDFASAVRKLAPQDTGHWKYEKGGSTDGNIGSSRSSQLLASPFNGYGKVGKLSHGDKLRSTGAARASPVWLETGEAVASMYSEVREEARDYARLRNQCFEQASQAYLIGNKALARELSVKGQLYNMQMKAAHGKAREAIYRQRNPISPELQASGRDRLIDLHGLHVSEAIHVLKHELSILRSAARSTGQRLPVMICVGTGHHTKGSRTPARLPEAVEQYLLEEGLQSTQPQAGLLRVVIY